MFTPSRSSKRARLAGGDVSGGSVPGTPRPECRGSGSAVTPSVRRAGGRAQGGRRSTALLSVEEAATLLGVARDTVYRAIRAGTLPLPVYVIGKRMRIPRLAVERLLQGTPRSTSEGIWLVKRV